MGHLVFRQVPARGSGYLAKGNLVVDAAIAWLPGWFDLIDLAILAEPTECRRIDRGTQAGTQNLGFDRPKIEPAQLVQE